MTADEAKSEVMRLRGLFPTITPEQGAFWKTEFQRHAMDDVRMAIDEHIATHVFFTSAALATRLRSLSMSRMADRSAERRAQDVATRREWDEIERTISAMADDELAEWVEKLTPTMPDGMRRMIGGRNPRYSATWKSVIYKAIASYNP